MKSFSKSKQCWIITFSIICLLSFVCAFLIPNGTKMLPTAAEGENSSIVYDYTKNKTLKDLEDELNCDFAADIESEEISVGTHTKSLADGGTITFDITAPAVKKVEEIVTGTSDAVASGNDANINYSSGTNSNVFVFNNDGSDENNVNDYSGNLSFYGSWNKGIGVTFVGENSFKYGLLQVRTKWQNTANYSLRLLSSSNNKSPWYEYSRGGYFMNIGVSGTSSATIGEYTAINTTSNRSTIKTLSYSSRPTVGDSVLITYGVYPEFVDGAVVNTIVLTITSADGQTTYLNGSCTDTTPTDILTYDDSANYFSFGSRKTKFTVEGVDKPLFTSYEQKLTETYNAGDALSTINVDGITFKTPTDKIVYGENSVQATIDYYKTGKTYDATVSFTGDYLSASTSKDLDYTYVGKTLSEITLDEGFEFAVEDLNKKVYVGTKTFIGTYNGTTASITLNVAAPTVQNIEDLVDDYDDVVVGARTAIINDYKTAGQAYAKHETNGNYAVSTNVATIAQDLPNANSYVGNISVHSSNVDNGAGITLKNSSEYGLVKFRTNFKQGISYSFGTMNIEENIYFGRASSAGGYFAVLSETNNAAYLGCYTTNTAFNQTYKIENVHTKIGDNPMIVTYGTYPAWDTNGVESTLVYLKLEKLDGTAYEGIYYVADSVTSYERVGAKYFSIGYRGTAADYAMAIEGVNEPLFENTPYKETVDTACNEGDVVSSVALPQNYTWNNSDVIEFGKSEYEALYSYEYYGKPATQRAIITLSGITWDDRTVVNFVANQTTIDTKGGKAGQTISFEGVDYSAYLNGEIALGWVGEDNKLYPFNYSFTVVENAELTYTLLTVDFKMYAGASVRTTTTNGYGGLRFAVMIEKEYSPLITGIFGAIVPYEDQYILNKALTETSIDMYHIENYNMLNSSVGAKTAEQLLENPVGYENYDFYTFALTDVLYENYNRDFAGAALVEVTYFNGNKATFQTAFNETDNVRSIYNVAKEAIERDIEYAENPVISGYISNVVEITDNGDGTYDVGDLGAGLARPYQGTATLLDDDKTLEVVLTVDEGSLLLDEDYAAMYINVYNGGDYILTRYVGTIEKTSDTTVVITVEIG